MQTTRNDNQHVDYLGADPSDRYAKHRRPIDVCGLTLPPNGGLTAHFWQWHWSEPQASLDVSAIAAEIQSAQITLIDGPQALASPGRSMRMAEQLCGAPGKTPDHLPLIGPFSGFIRSSVELFAACAKAGVAIGRTDNIGGMSETYPGAIWRRLLPGLPKKNTRAGCSLRKAALQQLGVTELPDRPSHDQLDACLCAVLAAAADGKIAGMSLRPLGQPLIRDADGIWREGHILTVEHCPTLHIAAGEPSEDEARLAVTPRFTAEQERALALRNELVERVVAGDAQLCTYAWAFQHIFDNRPTKWSQAYTRQVIDIARCMPPAPLQGLGPVCLDTFIVTARDGLPSFGHWGDAHYSLAQWRGLFARAHLRS